MSSYFRFVLFWLLLAHFCFLVCFYVGTICACHAAHSSCPFIVTANVSHRMRAKLSPTQSNTAQGNPSHRYCCPMSINLTSFVYMLNFVSHKMRVKLSPAQWYTASQGNPNHHHRLLWFPFIVGQQLIPRDCMRGGGDTGYWVIIYLGNNLGSRKICWRWCYDVRDAKQRTQEVLKSISLQLVDKGDVNENLIEQDARV